MLKGRETNKGHGGAPPADLLVCFPTRTRLSLMPKPICSPSRPNSEPNKRYSHNHHPGSPLIWAKDNQIRGGGPEMSEPTSPKVTCAGQIKVRHRSSNGCRNWMTVMEEIERIHNRNKRKSKKSSWGETFGFKKDVMGFLTCLRNLKFDFRCFGSFPEQILSSDEEEEDDDDDVFEEDDSFPETVEDDEKGSNGINDNKAVFSKWFMVLQENQNNNNSTKFETELENDDCAPAVPPPNALLLMRCRSAPAKSWLEGKENEEKSIEENEEEKGVKEVKEEEENEEKLTKKKRETLAIVMKYDADFYKLSTDIAQETWVVGEFKDPFSRSRSCRR
ncbi:uncharacterized protein LOC141585845 isoform X2 [Silene latifolia]|uniref:uncharacterized protein LOC141585845 isoform X2 n=1 Tax=Silene latifolia TaxID=37657 RepID=UPI003D7717AD